MKALSNGMKGYLPNKRPMTAPLSRFRDKEISKTIKPGKNQFYSYAGKKPRPKRKPRRKITEGTTTTCGCGRPVKFAVPLLCEDCWITKTFVRRA